MNNLLQMLGYEDSKTVGVFLCSISPEDFYIGVNLGIYGNRYFKTKSGKDLRDEDKLSIIRDLIAIRPGDLILLHVINVQRVYGVFKASSEPFYSEIPIWHSQEDEPFPCRFCFEPYEPFKSMIGNGKFPYINVSNLYEIIELEKIKSLISVEYERNVERRGVRKLLLKDGSKIIEHFLSNFETEENESTYVKSNYDTCNGELLKNKVFKVGSVENAVKSVILYELSCQSNFFNMLFKEHSNNIKFYDFANEVFISPITRKLMDIYVYAELNNDVEKHFVIEVKTGKVELEDLFQGIRYADLLLILGWISSKDHEREVIMVGKSFSDDVKEYVKKLNILFKDSSFKVRLIGYKPTPSKNWALFVEETP